MSADGIQGPTPPTRHFFCVWPGDVLGCVAPSVMKALRGESLAWLIRRHEIDWRNSHAHLVRQCRVFSVAGIRCSTALIAFLVFFLGLRSAGTGERGGQPEPAGFVVGIVLQRFNQWAQFAAVRHPVLYSWSRIWLGHLF